MIRLFKIYIGLVLTPILLPLSVLTLSWNPFRYFFLKRKKTEDGKGIYYLPEYSKALYEKMTIDSDIKAKNDLRTIKGNRAAFNQQNYRDKKLALEEEIKRQKRLKLLTSENKIVVILILFIFILLFIMSLYFFDLSTPTIVFATLSYISYSYFTSETIAKWFNAVIMKIRKGSIRSSTVPRSSPDADAMASIPTIKNTWGRNVSKFFKGLMLISKTAYVIYLILFIGILGFSVQTVSMWYVSWPAWLLGILLLVISFFDYRKEDKRTKTGFQGNEPEDNVRKFQWQMRILAVLLIILGYVTT